MSYYDMLLASKLAGGGGSAPVLEEVTKSYTANGDDVIEPSEGYDGLSKVNVSVNVSGGGEAPENDVEFIDYDGTIVYSYTAQEFLALDAMPANPTHEGLTAQGWNWTLADAKTYVADVGGLVIGQMYITDDGKTRIYITLPEGRTSPYLGIAPNGTAHVEWGDGTSEEVTGSSNSTVIFTQHNYANAGDYVIKITAPNSDDSLGITGNSTSSGSYLLIADSADATSRHKQTIYRNSIKKIEFGDNVSLFGDYSLGGLGYLESVSRPNRSLTRLNNGKNAFSFCYNLKSFTYAPNDVVGYYSFSYTFSLKNISFPNGFRDTNNNGTLSLFSNSSLKYLAVSVLASNGGNLKQFAANSHCEIIRIRSASKLAEQFTQSCQEAKKIVLGGNIVYFDGSNIRQCSSVTSIELPATVREIGSYCMSGSYSLKEIKFKSTTPPTVTASSAFGDLPTDCVIYVPYSEDHSVLNAYKAATNYPNPSTYTYVEY